MPGAGRPSDMQHRLPVPEGPWAFVHAALGGMLSSEVAEEVNSMRWSIVLVLWVYLLVWAAFLRPPQRPDQ